MSGGVYIRIGSNTRKANNEYVEDLIREGRRLSFDEEATSADIGILSNQLLKTLYKTNVSSRHLLAEKLVNQSSHGGKKFHPTIAGTLFFCENPEKYIPEALIICTRFSKDKPRDIIQTEEITGNLG
jgi:ATP-dependent DNA helicase RecG